jgi:hypothetical protein
MEGSGATRSRRRLAGWMEPAEAARVEKRAAIGRSRGREGSGESRGGGGDWGVGEGR